MLMIVIWLPWHSVLLTKPLINIFQIFLCTSTTINLTNTLKLKYTLFQIFLCTSTAINLTDTLKLKYTLLNAGACGRSEWYPPLWDNFNYFYVTTFNVLGRLDVNRPWGAARRSSVGCHTAPSIQTTWLVDVCKFYAACASISSRRPA